MDQETNSIIETLNVILAKMVTKDDLEQVRIELRAEMHEGFASIRAEMRDIRSEIHEIHVRLDAIEAELKDHRGYAKEIDHLMERVRAIEKHLGFDRKIAA
jgi:archaellum component FlaC